MIFKETWANPFLCALKSVELHVSKLAGMIMVISVVSRSVSITERYGGGNRLSHANTAVLKTSVEQMLLFSNSSLQDFVLEWFSHCGLWKFSRWSVELLGLAQQQNTVCRVTRRW